MKKILFHLCSLMLLTGVPFYASQPQYTLRAASLNEPVRDGEIELQCNCTCSPHKHIIAAAVLDDPNWAFPFPMSIKTPKGYTKRLCGNYKNHKHFEKNTQEIVIKIASSENTAAQPSLAQLASAAAASTQTTANNSPSKENK